MTFGGAVVWPPAPFVVPGLSGAADPGAPLRAACLEAWTHVASVGSERIVVVGIAPATATWVGPSPGSIRQFTRGAFDRDRALLPPALAVGAALLDAAGSAGRTSLVSVSADWTPVELAGLGEALVHGPEPVILVVLADGSARGTEKAPGAISEGAAAFNAAFAAAVGGGGCTSLSLEDGDEQLSWGVAPMLVLSGAATGVSVDVTMLADEEPYGVRYLVGAWVPRS